MQKGLPEADVAAIKQVMDMSLLALERNDLEGWLKYWTKDAQLMPPGMPSYKGHEQLKEIWGTIKGRKYILPDMQIEGRDDLAVIMTTISIPRTGPQGGADAGKQILKLRKESDGKWRLAAVVLNFDGPATL
jgi:uncharacterized protein (TIGR02246 family)